MAVSRKKLGKYEIIDRIGRGGMAEVYRGYHVSLDRYVAIKLLHPFLADDPEFKDRFENEARNVAKLRHPNIVQVYDFEYDDTGDSYYMVMEFINGPTLKDRLFELSLESRNLPVGDTVRIVRSAAEALAYAHQRNMIHRDVKPANLMLDEDGRLVLTDFGIAKIVIGTQFTASGGMVGTPAYMAPEQGLGEPGDERSDIYSLGVILYQLLTGRLPFDADTPLAIILKHVNEPLPDPRSYAPELSDALADIVQKALEKDPAQRYQTAIQFAQDLSMLDEHGNPHPAFAAVASEIGGTVQGPSDTRPVITPEQRARLLSSVATPPKRAPTLEPPVALESDDKHHTPVMPRNRSTTATTPATTPQPGAQGRLRPAPVLLLALILVAVLLLALALFGNDDSPLNSVLGGGDASVTPQQTLTALAALPETITPTSLPDEADPTEIPARRPTATRTATQPRSPTPALAATDRTATATSTPTPSNTPTRTPTFTRTPTPTRTPTATPTPSPSATPTPDLTGTAVFNFLATQAAASPTPNMTQTLAACDLQYIVMQPERYNQPPSFSDTGNPRLVAANNDFAFDIIFQNVGTCRWPEGARLRYNAELTENPDETVNLGPLENACGTNYAGLNFAQQERPNFFLTRPVDVTGQSEPMRFTGTAPNVFGCYYSVWDLLYPNSTIAIGRPVVLTIRVWGGG